MNADSSDWSAVILSGGRSTRLGRDKATTPIGPLTSLEHILGRIPADIPIVLVGPDPGPLTRNVRVCREQPPGGGPVAGLAAGLDAVQTPITAVLATDMPFAGAVLIDLVRALPDHVDGALAVDRQGRRQYLCAAYRTEALRAVLRGEVRDRSMHQTLAPLTLIDVPVDDDDMLVDIDTVDALAHAREIQRRTDAGLD